MLTWHMSVIAFLPPSVYISKFWIRIQSSPNRPRKKMSLIIQKKVDFSQIYITIPWEAKMGVKD